MKGSADWVLSRWSFADPREGKIALIKTAIHGIHVCLQGAPFYGLTTNLGFVAFVVSFLIVEFFWYSMAKKYVQHPFEKFHW